MQNSASWHSARDNISIQTEPSQHSRKNCLGRFSIARPNGQIPPQNNGMTSSSACPIRGSPSLRFHGRHQRHMGQASLFRLATSANEMPPALFYPCLRPRACHVRACFGEQLQQYNRRTSALPRMLLYAPACRKGMAPSDLLCQYTGYQSGPRPLGMQIQDADHARRLSGWIAGWLCCDLTGKLSRCTGPPLRPMT
jgi:hypothetical protein